MNRAQRLAATLAMPAIMATAIVFFSAQAPAEGTPVVETVLPANGVVSIERTGNVWAVTTESVPTEVKAMTPDLGPRCGVNYATSLGLCGTVTTFTTDAPCVYVQTDGILGHVSSDPYVCRPGGTPSTTEPSPSPSPSASPTSTSTPQPTTKPTSTPITTNPPPEPSPVSPSSPVGASTDSPSRTSIPDTSFSGSATQRQQLAATGRASSPGILAIVVLMPLLVGLGVWMISRSRRWGIPPLETQAELERRAWREGGELDA